MRHKVYRPILQALLDVGGQSQSPHRIEGRARKNQGLRLHRQTSLRLISPGGDPGTLTITMQKPEFHNGDSALPLIFKPPLHKFLS